MKEFPWLFMAVPVSVVASLTKVGFESLQHTGIWGNFLMKVKET